MAKSSKKGKGLVLVVAIGKGSPGKGSVSKKSIKKKKV